MKIKLTSTRNNQELTIDIPFREAPADITFGEYGPYINWTPDEKTAQALAKIKITADRLYGGRPVVIKDEPGVRFSRDSDGNYLSSKKEVSVRLAGRPDLAELHRYVIDYVAAETQARNEFWAKERAEAKASLFVSRPEGSILVKRVGSAPDPWEAGMSIGVWRAEDGREFAGEPDKQESGEGYITAERFELCAAATAKDRAKDAELAKQAAERRAREKAREAADPIPAAAYAAWKRYHGSADKAWEQEDEAAWALLNHYGYRIGSSPEDLSLAARERAMDEGVEE